jgi:hypothetical protein
MRRRAFIAGLRGASAWPLVAHGQHSAVPVIGYFGRFASGLPPWFAAFERGLTDLGYVQGQTIAVEYRSGPLAPNDCRNWPPSSSTFDRESSLPQARPRLSQ